MQLKLNTPHEIILDIVVSKVIAEGTHGSFCLLPRHVDFLAALVPGLLSWQDESGNESFAAVGAGILVKRGGDVFVSAEQASHGAELEELKRIVHDEFARQDDRRRSAHAAMAKMEASFMRRKMEMAEQTS